MTFNEVVLYFKGFICPSCYWGFLNAEDLQLHWEKEHAGKDAQEQETDEAVHKVPVVQFIYM